MKIFLLLLFFVTFKSFGATCTSTTRNNYTTNQVLTSSALNTDFNQLVTKANAFDGGCVTAGTVEYDALNTTQFAPILKGIKEGCRVTYSSATQVSVGKCLAAVNGTFVYTTIATTVAFGCTNCSVEASSTVYYVYIATGSSATTLTLLILTTAPNEDGYDASGNKVLGRFYNNSASNIDQYSIDQWISNQFIMNNALGSPVIARPVLVSAFFDGAAAITLDDSDFLASCTDADPRVCTFTTDYWSAAPNCWSQSGQTIASACNVTSGNITTFTIDTLDANSTCKVYCHGAKQ